MRLELLGDNANETLKDGLVTSEFDINGRHRLENEGVQRLIIGSLADEGGAIRMEMKDESGLTENTLPH